MTFPAFSGLSFHCPEAAAENGMKKGLPRETRMIRWPAAG